jgi:hypothetical protein
MSFGEFTENTEEVMSKSWGSSAIISTPNAGEFLDIRNHVVWDCHKCGTRTRVEHGQRASCGLCETKFQLPEYKSKYADQAAPPPPKKCKWHGDALINGKCSQTGIPESAAALLTGILSYETSGKKEVERCKWHGCKLVNGKCTIEIHKLSVINRLSNTYKKLTCENVIQHYREKEYAHGTTSSGPN